jgi:hypothetical protein
MTDGFDVAARMADGAAAVEHAGAYVRACHELGYQHPDLTTHAAQMRDWYAQEDGLDLRALNADCAALAAAATAADDALGRQATLMVELAGAWSGGGADAAREFLRRHGQAAATVRDSLRHGADAIIALRDELWRAVDVKVRAVQDIDDRRLAQRGEWLAAAQTVTTGAGDRATASEIVDQQIKPFVDNDIRSDWMAAMHTATASVTAAYDAAIDRLGAEPGAIFGVPGELGPSVETPEEARTAVATAPAGVSAAPPMVASAPPAVASAPPIAMVDPALPPVATVPAPVAASAAVPPAAMEAAPVPPSPPMSSPGGLGGGMPSLGSGASGFGQQLADLVGGLLGSSEGAFSGADEINPPDAIDEATQDDPALDEENADDETADEEDADEENEDDDPDPDEEPDPDAVEEPAEAETEPEEEPLPEPAPTPAPPPPEQVPPIPAAGLEAQPADRTPCEIAADELPQVGE